MSDTDQEMMENTRTEKLARERTPGPWLVAPFLAYADAVCVKDGTDLIGLARKTGVGTKADIILMAASPDLLAALQDIVREVANLVDPASREAEQLADAMLAAERAIAKATGGA